MTLRRASFTGLGVAAVLLLALAALWLARARLVEHYAQAYFRQYGVNATVSVGALGFSGASGRFALGTADAPDLAADNIELFFDPLRWTPYLVEVRLTRPVVRARLDKDGKVALPALQAWLDSLSSSKEKSPYVSDDLAVSFTGLRALLSTPGGTVEIGGDAKLVKMRPVSAALTVKPGKFRWRDITARVVQGNLSLQSGAAGYHVAARLVGDGARGSRRAEGATLALEGSGISLTEGGQIAAAALKIKMNAKALLVDGLTARQISADVTANNLNISSGVLTAQALTMQANAASAQDMASGLAFQASAHGLRASAAGVEGDGEISLNGTAVLPEALRKTIRALPLLAMDAPLKAAVASNLGPFTVALQAKLARHGGGTTLALVAPLTVRTARGAVLRIPALTATQKKDGLNGSFRAALSGGGLPPLTLVSRDFSWNGESLRAAVGLKTRLNFSVFKGIDASLDGTLTARKGGIAFALSRCTPLKLAAMASLAANVTAQLCPAGPPLFNLDGAGWRVAADLKDTDAALPLANAKLSDAAARLAFDGKSGPRGTVTVTAARVLDAATPLRFKPVTGTGTIALADNVWRGRLAVSDGKAQQPLGTVTLTHAMASGVGSAHIEAPLLFAQNGLQPEDLSPLLAPLKKADGHAGFTGDIAWDSHGLGANTGTLTTRGFDFLTPMGRAHALDATLALTSLLPPASAPGQGLSIARIDWTLPMSALALRFGFSTQAVTIDSAGGDIAEGHVALAPFAVTLASPKVESRATITGLSLAPLIAASNLSGKARLEGKLSGVVPFTAGAEGFRIRDGHLTADGPGRLELGRSLWGDSALHANAVQDFAYQALESLAFDSLSADINSVPGGRLQIVFHIKGKSDPPKPQVAEVAVNDILNGSALQKPIPLPSGTPIDLTLDTSLNFDELLQSYGAAWSKALNAGANP